MKIHYQDGWSDDVVAEIDEAKYREFLTTLEGRELAEAVDKAVVVLERDPRQSDFADTEVFFSYDDVRGGYCKPSDLLTELDEALA